ncbi:hypothetical protein BC567DRAFT_35210 [Phyllosticta citribraziliensis]
MHQAATGLPLCDQTSNQPHACRARLPLTDYRPHTRCQPTPLRLSKPAAWPLTPRPDSPATPKHTSPRSKTGQDARLGQAT